MLYNKAEHTITWIDENNIDSIYLSMQEYLEVKFEINIYSLIKKLPHLSLIHRKSTSKAAKCAANLENLTFFAYFHNCHLNSNTHVLRFAVDVYKLKWSQNSNNANCKPFEMTDMSSILIVYAAFCCF